MCLCLSLLWSDSRVARRRSWKMRLWRVGHCLWILRATISLFWQSGHELGGIILVRYLGCDFCEVALVLHPKRNNQVPTSTIYRTMSHWLMHGPLFRGHDGPYRSCYIVRGRANHGPLVRCRAARLLLSAVRCPHPSKPKYWLKGTMGNCRLKNRFQKLLVE
jgi:hypothetical protein